MICKSDVQELARALDLPFSETTTIASLWRRSLERARELAQTQRRQDSISVRAGLRLSPPMACPAAYEAPE